MITGLNDTTHLDAPDDDGTGDHYMQRQPHIEKQERAARGDDRHRKLDQRRPKRRQTAECPVPYRITKARGDDPRGERQREPDH